MVYADVTFYYFALNVHVVDRLKKDLDRLIKDMQRRMRDLIHTLILLSLEVTIETNLTMIISFFRYLLFLYIFEHWLLQTVS